MAEVTDELIDAVRSADESHEQWAYYDTHEGDDEWKPFCECGEVLEQHPAWGTYWGFKRHRARVLIAAVSERGQGT